MNLRLDFPEDKEDAIGHFADLLEEGMREALNSKPTKAHLIAYIHAWLNVALDIKRIVDQ